MLLFLFAVMGSALTLTQSSIAAPIRSFFESRQERSGVCKVAAKLSACPMCAGFWLGAAWCLALQCASIATLAGCVYVVAHGFAGSIVSALGVALWLLLTEATNAASLWRWLKGEKQ